MKIGLAGSMSVGKTTLAKALAELPEFKDYKIFTERSKELRDKGIPLNTDSTFKGQLIFLAERASELLEENMITDRTAIDVCAFTNLANSIDGGAKGDFESVAGVLADDYDFIFYIPSEGIEIENNGVRETDPEYRQKVDDEIFTLLEIWFPWYVKISGTTEERINQIKRVIG